MNDTLPFWIALAASLVLIPVVKKLARRAGLVAAPRADRWHSRPTPKIGGVAIYLAFLTSVLITMLLIRPVENPQWALLVASALTFGLGLYDDYKRLSPSAKLVGQILAAAIVVFFGRNIDFFQLEALNIIFTFAWLVGITNAINLLDNMDGLAGGMVLIAAGLLSFLFWRVDTIELLWISLALAGAVLGFLVFNFPPASIFMGDSGSLFLGFTLAALAIARVPQASNLLAVLGVPTLLFLLPILDTTLVTFTRILRGQSPTQGGKDHTSHRLIAFGLTEKQAVLVLYGVALISGVAGALLESLDYTISLILIPVLLVALTLLTAYLGRLKVVDTATPTGQAGITRLMVSLTFRGRILEIALDLLIISLAYYLAFWVHYGRDANIISLEIFTESLPIALALTYITFFMAGIYRGLWQYIIFRDLLRYGLTALGSVTMLALALMLLSPQAGYDLTVFALFGIFIFLGLTVSRSSFRILDQIYNQQNRSPLPIAPVLICGADDAGVMLLQWLLQDKSLPYKAVGFLDDDPFKLGRQIHNVRVVGQLAELDTLLERYPVKGIIFPNATEQAMELTPELRQSCLDRGVWVRRVKLNFEDLET